MPSPLKPREQGDWGELAAMTWLMSRGASVSRLWSTARTSTWWQCFGHQVLRIEVKTTHGEERRDTGE